MRINYRPEIDGLRAISIVVVILYHAPVTMFQKIFKGGHIGVDIFFIISGYLISSIIFKELIATGSFSFKNFYESRIRRLVPALLTVILTSILIAWFFLTPSIFLDFSKSILYVLTFISDFYYSSQEYNAPSSLKIILLHTWSLGIEVKFYITFPIILLITFKYFKKYLIHILILGCILSLGLKYLTERNSSSFSYYLFQTHIYKFLLGSILAYFIIIKGYRSRNLILNLILPTAGLFLIGYAILFYNEKIFYSKYYELSAIIGASLIIFFANKDELTTKILSTKLFVGIGLISYSLYLWHYPIFAFSRITDFYKQNIFLNRLILGIIIVIFSIVTYYFIEKPFQNKKYKFKFLFSIIIITVSILLFTIFNIIFNHGYKNRVPEILNNSYSLTPDLITSSKGNCHNNIDGCTFNTNLKKRFFLIGDSHVAHLALDLKEKVFKNKYQFTTFTLTGCFYFPGFDLVRISNQKKTQCNDTYFQKIRNVLLESENSIIIFGGRLPLYISNYYFDNKEGGIEGSYYTQRFVSVGKYNTIQNSFKSEILELSKKNKIILIYPIPEVGFDPHSKIFFTRYSKFFDKSNLNILSTSYKVYKDRTKLSFELLDAIKGDNIYRVYPHKLFCNSTIKDRCVIHDNKYVFYSDDDHPSSIGAIMINNLIMKEIKKIEKNQFLNLLK